MQAFTGTEGLKTDKVNANSEPLLFYQLFLTDEVFDNISVETNKYAAQMNAASFQPTTREEIQIFWGLTMLMGLVQKPDMKLYWATKELIHTPAFPKVMTRDRYMEINRYIHFADNATADTNDKLHKIRPYYEAVTKAFSSVYEPGEHINIDEALIRFFGRLGFKTYIANKPAKYGLKAYKLCDTAGYTFKFDLYTGNTQTNDSVYKGVTKVVMDLLQNYLGSGRKVWMDNYYNSPELFLLLQQHKTQAAGTLRINRRGVPAVLKKKKKRNKGEII